MSNKSAEKRERENVVRRMRNRQVKSAVRTSVKKFEAAVAAKDKEASKVAMDLSFKLLDSAFSKGVLHKNTASRKKARMHKAFNSLV